MGDDVGLAFVGHHLASVARYRANCWFARYVDALYLVP